MPYTFAIIGGGLTATSMLCQMVDRLTRLGEEGRPLSRALSILVFEKTSVFGPGLPHNDHFVMPFHITNMCTGDMSVRHDQPADFVDWIKQHPGILQIRRGDQTTPFEEADLAEASCRHYPRAVMGEYLKSRFEEAVENARALGVNVELCSNSEVIDLDEDEKRIGLTVRRMDSAPTRICHADGVLLATGHWFERSESKTYIPSPWPASRLLAAIPPGEKAGVIGSSLSAIEVVLTLTSYGRFERLPSEELMYVSSATPGKLTLHSRNGLLPRVRGRIGSRQNLYLTCRAIRQMIEEHPCELTLASVFELLDRELTAAYGSPVNWQAVLDPPGGAEQTLQQDIRVARNGDGPEGDVVWQTALVQIYPVVRDLYLNLTLSERACFDRHYNTLFFMHAATQPVINAEKLLALMKAGVISIVKLGDDYRFERGGEDGPFEFIHTGAQGRQLRHAYPYVVNACGQPRSLESDPAELTHNLMKRCLIQIEESRKADSYRTGSVMVDPATHRVTRPGIDGSFPCPRLYAVGAMTRGQMIDTSMAQGLIRSTDRVAEDLICLLLHSDHE